MHIPGMKVIVASTPRDGKGLLTSAIFDPDPCPFVETIRLQGQKGLAPTDPGFSIPLGQADVKRPGSDISLISYGRSVLECLAAAPIGRVAARYIPTPAAAALGAQIYPSPARVVAAAQQALNKPSARG